MLFNFLEWNFDQIWNIGELSEKSKHVKSSSIIQWLNGTIRVTTITGGKRVSLLHAYWVLQIWVELQVSSSWPQNSIWWWLTFWIWRWWISFIPTCFYSIHFFLVSPITFPNSSSLVPAIFPPTQGGTTSTKEWNGYQVVYCFLEHITLCTKESLRLLSVESM